MKRTLLTILVFLAAAGPAVAQQVQFPERPGDRGFIVDEAQLISPQDEEKIRGICDKLLTEKGVPIIVVTISGMAFYNAHGWSIERYAATLFDEWGIGYKEWNHGILLLVSVADRKARIELGADWGHEKDPVCRRIMDDWIIPSFKQGDFSGGIVAGVEKLEMMSRELEVPTRPTPVWVYLVWAGFIGLAIFTIVSLAKSGASGWAWVFWAVLFTIIGTVLYHAMSSRGGGGGFGGGSFGGGFSGGGGATGGW